MFIFSCTSDSYDQGEGKYSNVLADLSELTVNAEKQAISFVTDDGNSYTLTKPFSAEWIKTADTTYRAIMYYDKEDAGRAKAVSCSPTATLSPVAHWRYKKLPQDPVGLESAWLAKSGKYVNLGLLFKSGYIDDEEGIHAIGLACDTILTNDDQTTTAYYRLLHEQGDTPEYYTNRRYISILLPAERPDSVKVGVNTYNGNVECSFALSH
jgi:hypothetical protein